MRNGVIQNKLLYAYINAHVCAQMANKMQVLQSTGEQENKDKEREEGRGIST